MELIDMHCHLDFLRDPRAFADAAALRGMGFFATTVEPAGYGAASKVLAGASNVRLGVGIHPWWVHDGCCGQAQVDEACELMRGTRFVGEVGLDFGARHIESRDAQLKVFTQVARACAVEGGKLLSVHAVRSADAVLDVLEGTGALTCNQVILHWYSDSSAALWRAVKAGCYFSVNPRMLATKRGREYARILPVERLLLETDLPPQEEPAFSLDAWEADLHEVLARLAEIRGVDLGVRMAETSRLLLEG